MKRYKSVLIVLVGIAASAVIVLVQSQPGSMFSLTFGQNQAGFGGLQLFKALNPYALAVESEGAAECNAIAAKGEERQSKGSTDYPHGASNYAMSIFNMGSFMLKGTETALCHFAKSMGMNPDAAKIAAGGTEEYSKTFGGKTVALTVSKGSNYDMTGSVTVNGTKFMRLDWTVDAAGESKGYMSQGVTGIGGGSQKTAIRKVGETDFSSLKRAMHVRWDRSSKTAQKAEFIGGMFANSYLGATTDRAMYIYTEFNADTGAVTGHAVSIEKRTGNSLGCFRMYFTGTNWKEESGVLKGSLEVYKTSDAKNSAGGEATTATHKDGTDMDGVSLPSLQSANVCQNTAGSGCANVTTATITTKASFYKSCNDLTAAATATSSPFYNNDGNFTATASEVFGH